MPVTNLRTYISVVGGLTPDKLPTLRGLLPRQRAEQDGFFDRILTSYPIPLDATPESWMEIAPETLHDYRACLANLRDLSMVLIMDGPVVKGYRPFVVRLTSDGRQEWLRFTQEHAEELNDPDFAPHLRGPWSKFRGYCGRFALLIHFMRWAAMEIETEDVDGEDMRRAVELVRYLQSHARKVYAAMDADRRVREAKRVVTWLVSPEVRENAKNAKGFQGKIVTRRDIHRAVWGGSRTIEDAAPVLTILCEHGYLRELNALPHYGRGRKPSDSYEVNPFLALSPENLSRNSQNSRNSESHGDACEGPFEEGEGDAP
jgi:hypothetical protein